MKTAVGVRLFGKRALTFWLVLLTSLGFVLRGGAVSVADIFPFSKTVARSVTVGQFAPIADLGATYGSSPRYVYDGPIVLLRPRLKAAAPNASELSGGWTSGSFGYDAHRLLRVSRTSIATNTVAGHSVEDLVAAGEAADRNGLSAAGRALQKHGARAGSVFPEVTGGPSALNPASRDVLEGILNDPGKTVISRSHPSLGDVIDVRATSGQGVRFTKDGKFIGFLDPGRKP